MCEKATEMQEGKKTRKKISSGEYVKGGKDVNT